jgi:hypothetical protein
LEVSGQLHTTAALPPGKEPPARSRLEVGWTRQPFSDRRAEWNQYGLHPPLCELKIFFNI